MGAGQHIFEHRHFSEGARYLEGPADAAPDALVSAFPRYFSIGNPDRAGCGLQCAGNQVEERGLARAVRADQPDHLAPPQRHRHAIDRPQAAKLLYQVADLYQRRITLSRTVGRETSLHSN